MTYVGGGAKENGCIFCNRLRADDDVRSLIVHRGPHSFSMLNLFPYNTGHLMLVPNAHVASPELGSVETLIDMATTLPAVLRALRRVLDCDGFNVGFNIGSIAGAGVAAHFHEHVVPRWTGDANFMPILANTTVMPELLGTTYAKIRAEIGRANQDDAAEVTVAIIADTGELLVDDRGRLPVATTGEGESRWRAATRLVAAAGAKGTLIGWAGQTRVEPGEAAALAFLATRTTLGGGFRWADRAELDSTDAPIGARVVSLVETGDTSVQPS